MPATKTAKKTATKTKIKTNTKNTNTKKAPPRIAQAIPAQAARILTILKHVSRLSMLSHAS